jgi:hypothetical protein
VKVKKEVREVREMWNEEKKSKVKEREMGKGKRRE